MALTVALEAVLIGALVALFAFALARRHSHRRQRREVATGASEWINYADHLARWAGGSEQPGEGGMDDAERSGAAEAAGEAGAAGAEETSKQAGSVTAADIGGRVSSILKAAEETSDQIRAEARDAAAAIRRDAEVAVAERHTELERLSAEVEEAVRETREAADSYAEQRRREADEEAKRMLREASREARATREGAETMAEHIEAEAHARVNELEEFTGGLETYLRDVVSALHESSSRIESVIAEPSEPEQETLLEALEVERRPTSAERA